MNQQTRQRIAKLYKENKHDEIIMITTGLLVVGHKMGRSFNDMLFRLRDCGTKPDELSVATVLALQEIPYEKLNEIDRLAKSLAMKVQHDFEQSLKKDSSLAASSSSVRVQIPDEVSSPVRPEPVETWFFGEMQLDLSKSYDEIYAKAFDISEACGYMATKGKDCIQLYGEDCDDSITIVNTIYFYNGKVSKCLKHVVKDEKTIKSIEVQIA